MKCPRCGARVPLTRLLRPDSGGVACPSCGTTLLATNESYKYTQRREIQVALALFMVALVAIALSVKTGYWWLSLVTMLVGPIGMGVSSRWLRQRLLRLRATENGPWN